MVHIQFERDGRMLDVYRISSSYCKICPLKWQFKFKEFSILLKNLKLITGDLVAVDGAFLRANASKNTLMMRKTVKKEISKIDEDIKNYMTLLETLDKEDKNTTNLKISKEEIFENLSWESRLN